MKVLFLNPCVNAEHKLVKDLQAKGLVVLLPANAEEACQMLSLHGTSIDLAIVHREDQPGKDGEGGFKFLAKIKADAAQADLPTILTSQVWGDAEFAKHQDSPQGVNAYLKWPLEAAELSALIDTIFGTEVSSPSIPTASGSLDSSGLVLQDASSVLGGGSYKPTDTSIRLEAPEPTGSSEISLAPPVVSEIPEPVPTALTSIELSMSPAPEMPVLEMSSELTFEPPPSADAPIDVSVDAPAAVEASEAASDHQASQEMPYLFQNGPARSLDPAAVFAQPQGDSVVPGGAAQSPDAETLKKYLLLREQDVAVLSTQLKSTKDQLKSLDEILREERARNAELTHTANEQKRRIGDFEKEKQTTEESLQAEIAEMKFQLKARSDKGRVLESQVREAAAEMERLKDRVRTDIRKIRVREKELENRLEIMKKDSEALIGARENKIIELKRKLDLLEFNMDLLQDQHAREKEISVKLRERLAKAAQVVRVAGGLLDTPGAAIQLAAVFGTGDKDAA